MLFCVMFFFLSHVVGNGQGAAPGNCGDREAQWDRGANLKDYYSKREEQEAQAVSHSV